MQEMSTTVLAGAAGLMGYVLVTKFSPIAAAVRGLVYLRAAGYLLGEMADGAWARRGRFDECVERARREA